MTPNQPTALVEVVQADRDMAALLRIEIIRQLGPRRGLGDVEVADFDVQLFASHRIAALEEAARVAEAYADGNRRFLEVLLGGPVTQGRIDAAEKIADAIREAKGESR